MMVCFFLCSCVLNTDTEVAPKAVKGVLDLSNWDFDKDGPVDLSGEYAFYWNQLIYPHDFSSGRAPEKSGFIAVPGFWHTFKSEKIHTTAQGYATYHLRIIVNPNKGARSLAIKYLDMGSALNLFLDGKKICSVGMVGKTPETSHPMYNPGIADFQVNGASIDLTMQVSNFDHRRGGAWRELTLGKVQDIRTIRARRINYDVFLFGSIFVMAMYHLGLFFLLRKEISPIFFGAFCLLVAIRILTTGERYLIELFPAINWQLLVKLEYLSFYLAVPAFTQFNYHLFQNRFSKKICTLVSITGLVFSAAVILLPVRLFSHTLPAYQLVTMAIFFYALYVLIVASLNKELEPIIFLAGFCVIFLTAVNDILNNENIIQTANLIPLGLFLFIFFQAFLQSLRFSRAFSIVDSQRQKLRETNQALQREIADRPEAEKALRESHKRFLTVLDSIDADVYVADMQTYEILFMNHHMIKERALRHGIKLSNHLNGIPDTITADERMLKQIIYNLLSNAVKFTPDGGNVSLSAQTCKLDDAEGSTVDKYGSRNINIRVTDTGIGLNSEDLDRIFSPFEQVESSRSRKFQGTGLGLSLTKNLVELQGGRIWVESKGEGKGSTFSFIIPVTPTDIPFDIK